MERNSSEFLLQQIRSCTNLIHRLMHSEHRCRHHGGMEGGIGRGQGMVLRALTEQDGLTQSELAEELDIRPSSLGELVMKLEESGLIQRRRNEDNKRAVNVFLTETGREAEKELSAPRRQAAETWCSGLSDEERERLAGLLEKLIDSMEAALAKNEGECSGRETPFEHGCQGGGCGGHGLHGDLEGSHGCGRGHPCGGPERHRRAVPPMSSVAYLPQPAPGLQIADQQR